MTESTFIAAVFHSDNAEARLEEINQPTLRNDEVLVRLVATGICHTDVSVRDSSVDLPAPFILGHEGAGIVERVGEAVTYVTAGDPVVISFNFCGECPNCRKDLPAYCYEFERANFSGRRLDGSTALTSSHGEVSGHFFGQSSFATYSVASERNLVKVRDDAPLELLGPLGCGIQTGAGTVMNVLQPSPGDSIVIIGAGSVGLAAVMAAVVEGCDPIIVVEPNPARRQLAKELGAHHVFEQIRALQLDSVDAVMDTSGVTEVIEQALEALGLCGKLAIVTTGANDARLAVDLNALLMRGITIRGVVQGDSLPREFIPKLIDLIMDGRFPLQKLVRFYAFDDINKALADQENGVTVKPILRF
ncbi:NAD(P)-dependent alcohol dehydrogenase [Aliidiomarina sp. Khilg15.8]